MRCIHNYEITESCPRCRIVALEAELARVKGENGELRAALKPLQLLWDAYCELNEIERYCGDGYIHLSPDEVKAIVALLVRTPAVNQ